METTIKKARIAKGMGQKEVAITLNVRQPTVSAWESGRKTPRVINLIKLSELYDVPMSYLVNGEKLLPPQTHQTAHEAVSHAIFGEVRPISPAQWEIILRIARFVLT